MDAIDTGHLIYLVLLLVLVIGWFVGSGRMSLLKTLQNTAAWTLIILGTIAAVAIFQDIQGQTRQQVRVEDSGRIVANRQYDGHYHLELQVNGVPLDFLVDTGATDIVLTQQDAQAAGLKPGELNFIGRANTANGEVRTAPVRLDTVSLGPVTDRNVYAVVNNGEMEQSLLGMGYLQRWGKIEITGGELILTR